MKDIKVKPATINFLGENIGRTFFDIYHSKILFDPLPWVMENKTKNKWDIIKLKSFCIAKEIINKVQRKPSEWEKIIASKTTDKGLISKWYKQLNIRKITQSKSGQKT